MDYEKVELLIEHQRYKLAKKEIQQLMVDNGNDGYLHSLLAICLRNLGEVEAAIEASKEGIRLDPDEYFSYHNLAESYQVAEQTEDAIKTIKIALSIDPQEEDGLYLLSTIYFERGEYHQANDAIQKCLSLYPTNSTFLSAKARILTNLNRLEDAETFSKLALEKDPNDAHNHLTKANMLLSQKKWKEAQASYLDVLNIRPTSHQAQYGLRRTYRFEYLAYRVYHNIHRIITKCYLLVTLALSYIYFIHDQLLFFIAFVAVLFLYFPEPPSIILLFGTKEKRQVIENTEKSRSSIFYVGIVASILLQLLFYYHTLPIWKAMSYFFLMSLLFIFGLTEQNTTNAQKRSSLLFVFVLLAGLLYLGTHLFNTSVVTRATTSTIFMGLGIAYTSLQFYWDRQKTGLAEDSTTQ